MPRLITGRGSILDGDGNLLDNFEAEALECGDVHGGIGEKTNALNAQVREDLAAEADGAKNASGAVLRAFAGAQLLMKDEAAGFLAAGSGDCGTLGAVYGGGKSRGNGRPLRIERRGRVVDREAARGVVEIDNDAAARFGDDAHGLVEDFAAVAVGGEDVAGGAAGVNADEDGMRAGGARGHWLGLVERLCVPRSPNARDRGNPDPDEFAFPSLELASRRPLLSVAGPPWRAWQSGQRSPRMRAMWLSPPWTWLS